MTQGVPRFSGSSAPSGTQLRLLASRVRGLGLYHAYRLLSAVAQRVPPEQADPILDRVGDLLWLVNRPGRRAVEANVLHVIGERGPRWRRAVRGAFRHGARNYYDTFRLPRLTAADIVDLVPSRGWEHLDRALAAGQGAIVVGPHLSSLILGTQAIAARGYVVHAVVEPIEPPELLRLISRQRSGLGANVIPLGPTLGARVSAALRRNEVVGLIVDRDVSGSGIMVPFFGTPARLPPGPALIARRTGAAIVPAVVFRRPDGRFEGIVEPPIPPAAGRGRAGIEETTRAITARLEYYIGSHPEQWTVFQPVWSPDDPSGSRVPRGRNRTP